MSLGAYCVLTLPFALRAAVSSRPRCAVLGKSAVVLLLVAVALSQTRMAILVVPVVVLIWFAISGRSREILSLAAVTAVVFVLAFGGSFLSAQGSILTSTISYRGQSSTTDRAVQNLSGRKGIYETGWRAFAARPVLGYGMRLPTQNAQSPVFTRYGTPYAFESYLVVLPLEVGLLGLAAFLGFLASLVLVVRRHCPNRSDQATIYSALAGGSVLAVGTNAFDTEATYLWLMLGIMLAIGLRLQHANHAR